MPLLFEDTLRNRYEQFSAGQLDELVSGFIPAATYNQLETGRTAAGHEQIRAVMGGWRTCFQGARIERVDVRKAPENVLAEVPDATQCLLANFIGVGVYVQTVPGLEEEAPAKGQQVSLPVGETVWFNEFGQIIRTENSIKVSALR